MWIRVCANVLCMSTRVCIHQRVCVSVCESGFLCVKGKDRDRRTFVGGDVGKRSERVGPGFLEVL